MFIKLPKNLLPKTLSYSAFKEQMNNCLNLRLAHYNSRATGVAILFKKKLDYKIKHQMISNDGRFIILEIEIGDVSLVIANIYGPNEDKPQFFLNIFEQLDKLHNPYKLLGGDFNVVINPEIDRVGGLDTKPAAKNVILQYMDREDIFDLWRSVNPSGRRYTWSRRDPVYSASRIDYWLVTSLLMGICTDTDIPAAFISDHAPITIDIKISTNVRGRGTWMFNNLLLEDQDFVKLIEEGIDNVVTNNSTNDPRILWEVVKFTIRGESIKYSAFKKKSQQNKLEALEKKLLDIQRSLDQDNEIF